MTCFDSAGEKAFQAAMQKEASFLYNSHLDSDARKLRNITVDKANKFLQSIRELKKLTHSSSHKFYDDFLQAAASTLLNRTKQNYHSLATYYSHFKNNIEIADTSHRAIGGWNLFTHSLSFTAGIGGIAMGGMAIHVAIWSTATLAMGPWGIAALGAAIALIGLIVAVCEAYNLYQNFRLCRDKQFDEITEFVADLDPHEDNAVQEEVPEVHDTYNIQEPRPAIGGPK